MNGHGTLRPVQVGRSHGPHDDGPAGSNGVPPPAPAVAAPTAPVPTRDDVAAWSPEEREGVARLLDEAVPRPTPDARMVRRDLVLLVTLGGMVILLPWTGYLATTLPLTIHGGAWRTAWVGYDIGLAVVLGTAGWLAWRRRQLAVVALAVAATLLVVDAWFDLTLSWGTGEQLGAVLTAVAIEVPVAILLMVAVVSILRRSARTVALLRGHGGLRRSLWTQPLVMAPDPREETGAPPGGST